MKLGEMIALRRENLELTQEDLAFGIGACLESVQAFENGALIESKYFLPISKVLDLRPCVLCNWENEFFIKEWTPDKIEEAKRLDRKLIRTFITEYGVPFKYIDEIMCNLNEDTRRREERVAYSWARELTREDVIMLTILRGMSQEKRASVLAVMRKQQDNQ